MIELNLISKAIRKVFRKTRIVKADEIGFNFIIPIIPTASYRQSIEYGNFAAQSDTYTNLPRYFYGRGDEPMTDSDSPSLFLKASPKSQGSLDLPEMRIFRVKNFPEGMMCSGLGCNHIFMDGEPYVSKPQYRRFDGMLVTLAVCTKCLYKSTDGSYGR